MAHFFLPVQPQYVDNYCSKRYCLIERQKWSLNFAQLPICRRGQVVLGAGLALLRTFVRVARVLILVAAHTVTADSANNMSIGVVNEYPLSFGGGEGNAATERR